MAKKRPSFLPHYAALAAIAAVLLGVTGTVLAATVIDLPGAGLDSVVAPGRALGLFRTRWCGNGKLEAREQCDDGNRVSGDGCSRRCKKERGLPQCMGHALGERFIGPDGCNTCTCTADGPACTKMACVPRSSAAPGTKCLSSNQCGSGQYCTTEDGACESACEPGAQACIQACAGRCRPEACRPIVCSDGTTHPSCSADGHVINYFADPCRPSQPPVCGNGVCESTESVEKCDPASICRKPHYCPQDCGGSASSGAVSCDAKKTEFDRIVENNRTCSRDADCMLFEASCPYVTCGVAINRNAEGDARAAANAYTTCVERSGGPIACAGCVMQSVACVNNRCVTR